MSQPPLALVTGGSRGLGQATALKLARRGMRVIITARDQVRAEEAAAEMRGAAPGTQVEGMALDLASLASVRAFAATFTAKESVLQVLFNNAGLLTQSKTPHYTAEGHEASFGTNHLGHFLLTNLLLDTLKRAPTARIVIVSSRVHMPDNKLGPPVHFDFEDLRMEKRYDPMVAYKNSKLANLWHAYALSRKLKGTRVTVNAVCPGWVPETLAEHQSGLQRLLSKHVMPHLPMARTLDEASDSFVFMAVDPSLEGVSGKFYGEKKAIPSSPESYDEVKQERLWALSEELTSGVKAAHVGTSER